MVRIVSSLGGRVSYRYQKDGRPHVEANTSIWKFRDLFDVVIGVDLSGTRVTNAQLTDLKGLTELKWLDLSDTHATLEGVAELKAALPSCEILGP